RSGRRCGENLPALYLAGATETSTRCQEGAAVALCGRLAMTATNKVVGRMNFGAKHEAATPAATTPSPSIAAEPDTPSPAAAATKAPEKRRVNIRPLTSLFPYVRRYRGSALAALCALIPA